ncbi:MAG: response regulator, partial [Panacibacter sp.]
MDVTNERNTEKLIKALIVEDDLDICYLLSGILKQRKLASNFVNTLSDAEKVLRNEVPDIMIIDNHLPDGLGVEFISYIKTNYPHTRIIMITAHDTVPDRMHALN